MTDKVMMALDPDELAFIKALHTGDDAAVISIFVEANGTKTLDIDEYIAAPPKAEQPEQTSDMSEVKPAPAAQPIQPTSVQTRNRQRNRKTAPDVRFEMLSMLEEIRDLVNDTACRIARQRFGGDSGGIFEEDRIADELISGLADYFSIQPDLGQLASQYHVNWFFDIEWDYSKKTYTALDRTGKVQAVEQVGEPDELDSKHDD